MINSCLKEDQVFEGRFFQKSKPPTSSFRIQFSNIRKEKKFRKLARHHAPVWDLPNDDFFPDSLSMTTFLLIWKMNFVWRPHLSSTKDFLRPFCPLVPCSILNHSGWNSIKKSHFQTYTSKSSYFSFSNKIWSLRYFWYFSTTVQQSDKNVWDLWITQTF